MSAAAYSLMSLSSSSTPENPRDHLFVEWRVKVAGINESFQCSQQRKIASTVFHFCLRKTVGRYCNFKQEALRALRPLRGRATPAPRTSAKIEKTRRARITGGGRGRRRTLRVESRRNYISIIHMSLSHVDSSGEVRIRPTT